MSIFKLCQYMKLWKLISITFTFCFFTIGLFAQVKVIKGKIVDEQSEEPIPFANLILKGTSIGTPSDFDGNYRIEAIQLTDSMIASCIGYESKHIAINKNIGLQTLEIRLRQTATNLSEVIIVAGENPAWEILRKIIKNKSKNDCRNLDQYQYQSYTRSELDIDKIASSLKKSKLTGKAANAIDKITKIANEDGKQVLPVFLSEAVSNFYYNANPLKTKEIILKSKVTGVGIDENSILNQFVGQGVQNFNFYNNYITILNKDIASPITDAWKLAYKYYLIDSVLISERENYLIEFKPRNKQDLAFIGKLWIDKQTYALTQIDITLDKTANINFVEKIKMQQEFVFVDNYAWLPAKGRLVMDISQLQKYSSGILVKSNVTNRSFDVVNVVPKSFFDKPFDQTDTTDAPEEYWENARPTALTEMEKLAIEKIDTIKNLPIVKSWSNAINILVNGYVPLTKGIELGPWQYAYAFNSFEGHRFRIGFKTNSFFSKTWFIQNYIAYSTKDPFPLKGKIEVTKVLAFEKYKDISFKAVREAEQIGVNPDDILNFNSGLSYALFGAFARYGRFARPYYLNDFELTHNNEPAQGLSLKFSARVRKLDTYFPFAYNLNNGNIAKNIASNELTFQIRYAPGEYSEHSRNNIKRNYTLDRDKPIYTLRYTYGTKVFGADFEFHKLLASFIKTQRVGLLGRARIEFYAGYIPNTIPYPFLFVHQGNSSPIMIDASYNLMDFFEFINDKYISTRLYHDFEGLFFNRVPLLNKWAWRAHAGARLLYGGISQENINLIAPFNELSQRVEPLRSFNNKLPYAEVFYGVDNIFKFLSIDFIHRLTYLQNTATPRFAVKFSFVVKL